MTEPDPRRSKHAGGPPDHHPYPCRPWHRCDWCPCRLDDIQTHAADGHDDLAARAKEHPEWFRPHPPI